MSDTPSATGDPREEQGAVGPRIQALRRRAGLSQEAAASRAGISTRALRDIERGRARRPRPRTLRSLAATLGLSGEELADLLAAPTGPPRDTGRPRLLVLGPLALQRGRTPLPVTSPMLRRLLGLLALKHPESATQQEITDILWPSGPPHSHPSLIHTYVSQARRLLATGDPRSAPPQAIARTPTGYRLEVSRNQIDLGHFDEVLTQAQRPHRVQDREALFTSLAGALRCWRGPVLADADPVLRRHPAAVAADERRVRATMLHADTALLLRRSGEAVPVLAALVNTEPLHEGLHARLILGLADSGEQAAALDVFGRLRDRLDEELGIEPGPEVSEAHLRVLRGQLPRTQRLDDSASAGRTAMTHPIPAQLPAVADVYVGRRSQTRVLDTLVLSDPARRSHLAVVVGAPGIGKTALATHWAHARREHFADGQLFIDLRGYSRLPALRPGDVLAQFLRALGVRSHDLPQDEDEAAALYRTLLADRRLLVVLDNARDAEQVRPLIPGARGCAVVITSRGELSGLVSGDGARRIALDALDPDEACRLLSSIVGACNVAAEKEAARRLVALCGGLPLAIRIAAANLVAGNARIADHCAELEGEGIIGRLHIEGDRRSAVRAAFDLSYRALPAGARRMFRLLGLLPGHEVTLEDAAALADSTPAAVARILVGLADAHLVRQRAFGRFELDVLLHAYARELASGEEAHAAHRRLDHARARELIRSVDGQERGQERGEGNCSGSSVSSAGSRG
ncbi:BTAD domain-containing putative transcriptional regulator [Streptomyces sp. NPDC055107]